MAHTSPHSIATDDKPADAARDQQRNSNLARIRDNQRRSRARRKEYLEELEGRLRNCQQLGVEASAEIQAAARRVVDENKRLRQLLKRQGLSDAEIDGLPVESPPTTSPHNTSAGALEGMLSLRRSCNCDESPGSGGGCNPNSSMDSMPTFPPSTTTADPYLTAHPQRNSPPPSLRQPVPVSFQHLGCNNTLNPFPPAGTHPPLPAAPEPTFDPLPRHDLDYELGFDEPTGWLMNFDPTSTPSAPADATPRVIPASPAAAPVEGTSSLLFNNTSSCVAAADLIRTIKPDIELAELERELGCADGGECKVSLTQIFSIMDRVAERGS